MFRAFFSSIKVFALMIAEFIVNKLIPQKLEHRT